MTNDHDHDPFDELARRAGVEVRRSAPEGGLARLQRARRRRRTASAAAGATAALLLVAGTAYVATRGDDGAAPPVETPTIQLPVSSAPPEPPASSSSAPMATDSTAAPTTPTTGATTSTAAAVWPTIAVTSAGPPPPQPASSLLAVTYVGRGQGPWAPIGWWDGTGWVDPQEFASSPESPIATVTAVGPSLTDGPLVGLALGEAGEYCAGPELGRYIDLGRALPDENPNRGYGALAVTASWPIQPRPVIRAGADAPVYQEVGESLVVPGPGIDPTNGDVIEVYRSDLDGDGIEEVIFTFEHLTEPSVGAAGDFSLVIARFAHVDGSVDDQVLFEYYAEDPVTFPNPGEASVLGIADLNGDGTMEVVLRSTFWEASIAEAYELQSGRLVRVLAGGCGV